jgi:hypothetical protein
VEAVLCLPPGTPLGAAGITRASLEFVRSDADAGGEAAPGFASLAAMRGATGSGSRFFYHQASGLLFLRLRQAAGWGGAPPTGYCPPGGCAALFAHVAAVAPAPSAAQCEARLAGLPGGAPIDVATDPFLAAALPLPLFDLRTSCPDLPPFGCDCWGWVGCANRACTAAEAQPCVAGVQGGGLTPPPAPRRPPPPKPFRCAGCCRSAAPTFLWGGTR